MNHVMTDDTGRRRESRFTITDPLAVSVTLEFDGESMPAELMDLSRKGMRLSVLKSIANDTVITIKMVVPSVGTAFESQAKICWVSPGVKDGWFVGCALIENLEEDCIAQLASFSILDRRRDSRQSTSLAAEAKSELGSEFSAVELIDYSSGGFCAVAEAPIGKSGDRIMLRIPLPNDEFKTSRAKIAWIRLLEDGSQMMGCSFLTREDYQHLRSVVDPGSRNRWLRNLEKYRPTNWRTVAAAVLLILTLELVHIARTRPDLVQSFDRQVIQRVEPLIDGLRQSFFGKEQSL